MDLRKGIFALAALLCIGYGLCIFALRSGSRFFLMWIAMGAGFLALFFLSGTGFWESVPTVGKAIFASLLILAVGAVVFCEALVISAFGPWEGEAPDVIIVLGAQVWPDGPSVSLKYRLDTAVKLLNENRDTVVIVSGGQGSNEPFTEAEGMYNYLTEAGIDPGRILREERSTNTVENIRFSMELTDLTDRKVGIVTNNFHIYRSVAIARKQGLRDAFGIAAPSTAFYLPNNMFRECFGIIKDVLRHNMDLWQR